MPPPRINPRHRQQLNLAVKRFRDHEGLTFNVAWRWFQRFDDADSELALKVLENIRYYSGQDIRQMLTQLVAAVFEVVEKINQRQVFFVPVGEPGASGSIIARALRDTPGVRRNQIRHMADIEKLPSDDVRAIVFLDDFSGTGGGLEDWWANVEPIVLPKGALIIVALLVTNHLARPRIEAFARVVTVDELTEDANVFSPVSMIFDMDEKDLLLNYCRQTGCQERFIRGYGECGLLLAFRHGCPNNSLPILWFPNGWGALFRRSAI